MLKKKQLYLYDCASKLASLSIHGVTNSEQGLGIFVTVVKRKANTFVVVVYQCTIIKVMDSLGELKLFCMAWFTLC